MSEQGERLFAAVHESAGTKRTAGGSARFELLHGVPGDGHLLRLYPDRVRSIADQFLATLDLKRPAGATVPVEDAK